MRNLLLALILLSASLPLQAARLVVMDVGEGQALFLQQGHEALLIDTGHAGMAPRVLQRLRHYGVTSLRGIVLTHLHPDHASGYFRIREAFPEAPVMDNGQSLPPDVSPDMVRWVAEGLKDDPRRQVWTAGDRHEWGELRIEVLWPRRYDGNGLNLHSLVLLVWLGETRVLLMGDAPQAVGKTLLRAGKLPAAIDVLVVGHHGAADSSAAEVLQRLSPRYSVISVNAGNLRGYPAGETVQRLLAHSGRLYRTDVDGEVCLRLRRRHTATAPCP